MVSLPRWFQKTRNIPDFLHGCLMLQRHVFAAESQAGTNLTYYDLA
jgi:hypothetical protein